MQSTPCNPHTPHISPLPYPLPPQCNPHPPPLIVTDGREFRRGARREEEGYRWHDQTPGEETRAARETDSREGGGS